MMTPLRRHLVQVLSPRAAVATKESSYSASSSLTPTCSKEHQEDPDGVIADRACSPRILCKTGGGMIMAIIVSDNAIRPSNCLIAQAVESTKLMDASNHCVLPKGFLPGRGHDSTSTFGSSFLLSISTDEVSFSEGKGHIIRTESPSARPPPPPTRGMTRWDSDMCITSTSNHEDGVGPSNPTMSSSPRNNQPCRVPLRQVSTETSRSSHRGGLNVSTRTSTRTPAVSNKSSNDGGSSNTNALRSRRRLLKSVTRSEAPSASQPKVLSYPSTTTKVKRTTKTPTTFPPRTTRPSLPSAIMNKSTTTSTTNTKLISTIENAILVTF